MSAPVSARLFGSACANCGHPEAFHTEQVGNTECSVGRTTPGAPCPCKKYVSPNTDRPGALPAHAADSEVGLRVLARISKLLVDPKTRGDTIRALRQLATIASAIDDANASKPKA